MLSKILDQTAKMIALWQANGFCHGVMNTDNFSNEALKQELVFKEYISTEEAPFKKQRVDMSIKPITLGVACNKVFDTTNYEKAFLGLLSQNRDNIVNYVIEYIRTSMERVTGLKVGVIVMNYAGNYITDNTNYQMITLSQALKVSLDDIGYTENTTTKKRKIDDYSILDSNFLKYAKYKCIEYSIAQMLILLLVFKSINTDAHKSNFLTIFYKKVPSDPCLENIITWMIDMGRLVDVKNISNIFNYNYGEYSSQFNKFYGKEPSDYFYNDRCNLVLTTDIWTLFDYSPTEEEKILLALHYFTTFITVIDCIVNNHRDRKPKCAFVIEYLVDLIDSNRIDSMIHFSDKTYFYKNKALLAKSNIFIFYAQLVYL
jgi:hypothetical protein